MVFKLDIIETLLHHIEIEANTKDEAIKKFRESGFYPYSFWTEQLDVEIESIEEKKEN